jgi:hypothetical protein
VVKRERCWYLYSSSSHYLKLVWFTGVVDDLWYFSLAPGKINCFLSQVCCSSVQQPKAGYNQNSNRGNDEHVQIRNGKSWAVATHWCSAVFARCCLINRRLVSGEVIVLLNDVCRVRVNLEKCICERHRKRGTCATKLANLLRRLVRRQLSHLYQTSSTWCFRTVLRALCIKTPQLSPDEAQRNAIAISTGTSARPTPLALASVCVARTASHYSLNPPTPQSQLIEYIYKIFDISQYAVRGFVRTHFLPFTRSDRESRTTLHLLNLWKTPHPTRVRISVFAVVFFFAFFSLFALFSLPPPLKFAFYLLLFPFLLHDTNSLPILHCLHVTQLTATQVLLTYISLSLVAYAL